MGHIETPNYNVLSTIIVILKIKMLKCKRALKPINPQLMHTIAKKHVIQPDLHGMFSI
jgi:hypothetical protein